MYASTTIITIMRRLPVRVDIESKMGLFFVGSYISRTKLSTLVSIVGWLTIRSMRPYRIALTSGRFITLTRPMYNICPTKPVNHDKTCTTALLRKISSGR